MEQIRENTSISPYRSLSNVIVVDQKIDYSHLYLDITAKVIPLHSGFPVWSHDFTLLAYFCKTWLIWGCHLFLHRSVVQPRSRIRITLKVAKVLELESASSCVGTWYAKYNGTTCGAISQRFMERDKFVCPPRYHSIKYTNKHNLCILHTATIFDGQILEII